MSHRNVYRSPCCESRRTLPVRNLTQLIPDAAECFNLEINYLRVMSVLLWLLIMQVMVRARYPLKRH